MSVPNFTVWAFRNLIGADGRRLEIRFSKNEHYKYGVDNPGDVIFVDDMVFPPELWGDVGFEEFDEDGDAVPISFNFGISDQFTFSGVLGDASVITLQDLRTENTTLLNHIFDDLSRNTDTGKFNNKWYVWLSWLNADDTMSEIFYSGSVDLSKINSIPYFTESFLTDDQNILETIKFQTSTISDVLSQIYVQELVETITQADMAHSTRDNWYAGYTFTEDSRVHYPGGNDIPPVVSNFNGDGDNFKGELKFELIAPDDHLTGYLPAYYPSDENTDLNPFNGNVIFNDRVNVYGVKHGFQGISYQTLLTKIAGLGEFTFATPGTPPFTVYKPYYTHSDNSDHYALLGLDSFIDSQLSSLYRNYNVLFGVRPDDPLLVLNAGFDLKDGVADYTKNGRFSYRTINSTSGTSPVVFVLDSAPDAPLHVGQAVTNIYVSGSSTGDIADTISGNMYIHSIIDDTHITLEFGEGNTGHANGDIVNTGTFSGSFVIQWMSEEWYDGLQTPVTIPRSDTLLSFMIAILDRNGLGMEWDIEQSGADIGKPILRVVDLLDGTHTAPTKWASPTSTPKILRGAETQNLNLAKTAVKLTYMGDTTAVYCPRKPKVGESAVEKQIISRVKKWGEFTGYRPSNFINNRDNPVQSQNDTFYRTMEKGETGDIRRLELGPLGYLIGANDFFFFPDTATQIYNTNYNTHFPKSDHTDASGFYAASYEQYGGSWGLLALTDVNKDKYNTLVAKAQVFANLLLYSKNSIVRPMRGMTDDSGSTRKLLRRLKTHWRDPDGTVTYKRSTKTYINVRTGKITVHWVKIPASFTQFPYVIEDGSPSTGGGIAGGGISGGGGGGSTNLSGAVIKSPDSVTRNDITPTTDDNRGLAIHQFSDTQAEHLFDMLNDDGTIILSGITEAGTFFSNLQSAFVLNPWGTSAGNTGELRFMELAANGTNYAAIKGADAMAGNITFTLPADDGLQNYIFRTDGSGVLTLVSVGSLLVEGTGITMTENIDHTVTIDSAMVIGESVVSGDPGAVLWINASSQLDQDNSNFVWDPVNSLLYVTNFAVGNGNVNINAIPYTFPSTDAVDTFLMNGTSHALSWANASTIRTKLGTPNIHVHGGTIANPSGVSTGNYIIWRAPYACTVTNVRGYRSGGTGATINARKNGSSNHLGSDLSLTSADTWMDGGSVSNTSYAAGDKMEIMIVSVTGSPTEIAIQIDVTT